MSKGIVFQVATDRVISILAKEIYDSPLALLRENVQNAYDAVRMRFASTGTLKEGGRISISLEGETLSITDNGVGMTETVLRENFWKAGSSGKNSDGARRAGVVGTFGIGAMANFGVCRVLKVETRAEGSDTVLVSTADIATLKIAEECISFETLVLAREVGTTLTVTLDEKSLISASKAKTYLKTYVGLLPVPVYFNSELISQQDMGALLNIDRRSFNPIGKMSVKYSVFNVVCDVRCDANGQILVHVTDIRMGDAKVEGSLALLQSGGQLMGFRSNFGLAPAPVFGVYQFGGWANLSFLKPTAGREALSRESIEQIGSLIRCAEYAASEKLARTDLADRNTAFIQWITQNDHMDFAGRLTIHALPDDVDVELANISQFVGKKTVQYYAGSDKQIIHTFANQDSVLLQIAQAQARRRVQLSFLKSLKVEEVPDTVQATRTYQPHELKISEASVLLRVGTILRDDYLIPDVSLKFVDMSHGVTVRADKVGDQLQIQLARSSTIIQPLLQMREKAPEVFGDLMKDFVRNYIYKSIQEFVPSSTRGGVDALRKPSYATGNFIAMKILTWAT